MWSKYSLVMSTLQRRYGSRTMRTGPERYRPAMAVGDVVRVPLLPSPDTDCTDLLLMVVSAGAMTWASVIGALPHDRFARGRSHSGVRRRRSVGTERSFGDIYRCKHFNL